jgi:hypothetical protein
MHLVPWLKDVFSVRISRLSHCRTIQLTDEVLIRYEQTVLVVILLSADFWTVRVSGCAFKWLYAYKVIRVACANIILLFQNVSGRVLVGLRFWNQVDDDGTRYTYLRCTMWRV